ncbi:unnamed protein product [Ilex paraguariensis]|uniref:LETM1-like protein n=1 Tax=Ilex paraguariensis TaxID=185542 RepID=A0ABC8TZD3_9AQUA
MASRFCLQLSKFYFIESVGDLIKHRAYTQPSKFNLREDEQYGLARNGITHGFLFTCYTFSSQSSSSRWLPPGALSSTDSSAESDQVITEDKPLVPTTHELARSGPELAMAWNGVDVHAWHKHLAYRVAVYALLKAVIEVELFLSHKRSNNPSLVHEILSPKANSLGECIESQLNLRNPKLVQWFRTVELPRIAGLFIPLFKKWSVEYAGSGVAGIILAISCCAAVRMLGSGRTSCPLFTVPTDDLLVELLNFSHSLVSVDKLHQLASEAGFEEDFLSHFGTRILPNENIEDVEFWIGLVQRKLSKAFHRESVISDKHTFSDKVDEKSLATLGLFAFLGRETRLFLSGMGIKDLDEQVKDLLSYLECGSLFIYPKFSSVSEYQLFMEVVTDEIGWLDFYAAFTCKFFQEKRRSKQHAIQAETEIILCTVFTVCYDVISGFAHYSNSTQQPLDSNLLAFLLRSQSLLSICLEDYWAAYDRSGELLRITERGISDPAAYFLTKGTTNSSVILEAQQLPIDLLKRGKHRSGSRWSKTTSSAGVDQRTRAATKSKALHKSLLQESTVKLISTSADMWMGTQLLFIDILNALKHLVKKLRGCKLTKRERKKVERTLVDIAALIPVTVLMLLPVSAVGHAAMFAAIKKYMPAMIPSPYCSERLNLLKQLKRAKKMEVQSWNNIEDASSTVV